MRGPFIRYARSVHDDAFHNLLYFRRLVRHRFSRRVHCQTYR